MRLPTNSLFAHLHDSLMTILTGELSLVLVVQFKHQHLFLLFRVPSLNVLHQMEVLFIHPLSQILSYETQTSINVRLQRMSSNTAVDQSFV